MVLLAAWAAAPAALAQDLAWIRRPPGDLGRRTDHVMAYDSARGVTVLFGGYAGFSLSDTWEWDGTSWTPQSVSGPRFLHYRPAMAYDSVRGVMVLVGGGTWEWDGTSPEWVLRTFEGPSNNGELEWATSMAFDTSRGVSVLFGAGRDLNETWEWDGTSWTQRMVAGPSAGQCMAYDSARQVVVLVGFGADINETWEWDGASWTQRMVAGPPMRARPAIAYDAARMVIVLFGFNDADTWELAVFCRADFNHDARADSQDFFDFLTAFFAGDADVNDDGSTNSQDFLDFLAAFFVGCA